MPPPLPVGPEVVRGTELWPQVEWGLEFHAELPTQWGRRVALATSFTFNSKRLFQVSVAGPQGRQVKRRAAGVNPGLKDSCCACLLWLGPRYGQARGLRPATFSWWAPLGICKLAFLLSCVRLSHPLSFGGHTQLSLCARHWARCWGARGGRRGASFLGADVF